MSERRGKRRTPKPLYVGSCRRCGSDVAFDAWAMMPRSTLRCATCGLPASPPALTYLTFPVGLLLAVAPIRGLFTAAEGLFGKPMPALAFAGCFVGGIALSLLIPGLVNVVVWRLLAVFRR